MEIRNFWAAVLRQDREALAGFFWEDAVINWHNTNECFTAAEFIQANCGYPGQWDGKLERIIELGDQVITVTHVYNKEGTISCHAVSFLESGKIRSCRWMNTGGMMVCRPGGGRICASADQFRKNETEILRGH